MINFTRVPVTGRFGLSYGTSTPEDVPFQVGPIDTGFAAGGVFDESVDGNIFQVSSWVRNSGSSPAVAVFGEGIADAAGASAWGGNFVGYANAPGSLANGLEIDFGTLGGGVATGVEINVCGGALSGNGVVIGQNGANSQMANGIVFRGGATQVFQQAFISTDENASTRDGIDFSGAGFGGYPFKSPGYSIDGVGNVRAAGYFANGAQGVSFTGPPTANFTVVNGIVVRR